jgi:hypothetical protein
MFFGKNGIIMVLVLFSIKFILPAWSPSTETYTVVNDTGNDISFDIEYKPDMDYPHADIYFDDGDIINKLRFWDRPTPEVLGTFVVPPDTFSPFATYIKNIRVDILQKFQLIVENIYVYDSEGYIIMTKEDIKEDSFIVDAGNITDDFIITVYGLHITQEIAETGRKKHNGGTAGNK